jgi:hypothetical protein
MPRDEVNRLVAEFCELGEIARLPEGAFSVDWRETKLRKAARAAGARGHRRRWVVRRNLAKRKGGKS